ncbi:hypothetical protein DSC45_00120 [Streptomyces sp. YIM 130001]|uniref:DUF2637 domain-containing protein n=1 Tax=Streptomyces sp. YIM 130001 TaxID=2259644 RepID=UPI000ECF2D86|nr:DUF2637 domain-containing protein [Streptomyces sp. YIM 130001]RII22117.1 hypothetical protein DSC45_00120 [Streptomyces sp. YIM 130001]
MAAPLRLTRTHRILIAVVIAGAIVIAGIGFAGSYSAVRDLAEEKGFGGFAVVFPIGIDAGICVLLALDLLLTWIRIPFPLLRQTAWLLTAATIAFNGAAAWPDPLGVGMHAVIPILFVVSVEAARHAIGRIADITADKHMEGVRLTRWLLSPLPTFLLWRRMKLWELRSYEQVIKLEQERLVYQARLRSRYGRNWRRKAPVESLMPLRLAKYGVPLAETGPAGLAAAGIEPQLLPPAPEPAAQLTTGTPARADADPQGETTGTGRPADDDLDNPWFAQPRAVAYEGGYDPDYDPEFEPAYDPAQHARFDEDLHRSGAEEPARHEEDPYRRGRQEQGAYPQPAAYEQQAPYEQGTPYEQETPYEQPAYDDGTAHAEIGAPDDSGVRVPAGPNRTRPLTIPGPRTERPESAAPEQAATQRTAPEQPLPTPPVAEREPEEVPASGLPDDVSREDAYFGAFRKYVSEHGDYPNARQFGLYLQDLFGVTGRSGGPLQENSLRPYLRGFRTRYQQELDTEYSV